jgi:hypothetical protein
MLPIVVDNSQTLTNVFNGLVFVDVIVLKGSRGGTFVAI